MRSKPQGAKKSGGTAWVPKQGRPSQAIIESNRKTELCRNWQNKGTCSFGARCAFAHGEKELKYRTLREMENAGRIPDASKYRCYPCMTWVATGSCPYSSRCVFIHDPRVKGPVEAWLYAGCQAKSPSTNPSSDSSFFFPDMARNPDSLELPTHPARYDLDSRMATTHDLSNRAVYKLWYSFVSTLLEAAAEDPGTTARRSISQFTSTKIPPPSATAKPKAFLATASHSPPRLSSLDDDFIPPSGNHKLQLTSTDKGCYSYREAATAGCCVHRSQRRSSGGPGACCGHSPSPTKQQCLLLSEEVPLAREKVSHLPVFLRLSKGIPARPMTPPSPLGRLEAFPLGGSPSFAPPSFWDALPAEFLALDSFPSPRSSTPLGGGRVEDRFAFSSKGPVSPTTDAGSHASTNCTAACSSLSSLSPGSYPDHDPPLRRHETASPMPAACAFDATNHPEHQSQRSNGVASMGDPGGNIPLTTATRTTSSVRAGYSVVRHGLGGDTWAGVGTTTRAPGAALLPKACMFAVPSF